MSCCALRKKEFRMYKRWFYKLLLVLPTLIPPTEPFSHFLWLFLPLLKYANLSLSKYICDRKLQIQCSNSVNLFSFWFLSPLTPSMLSCWHSHRLVPFSPRVTLQKRCMISEALFFLWDDVSHVLMLIHLQQPIFIEIWNICFLVSERCSSLINVNGAPV